MKESNTQWALLRGMSRQPRNRPSKLRRIAYHLTEPKATFMVIVLWKLRRNVKLQNTTSFWDCNRKTALENWRNWQKVKCYFKRAFSGSAKLGRFSCIAIFYLTLPYSCLLALWYFMCSPPWISFSVFYNSAIIQK